MLPAPAPQMASTAAARCSATSGVAAAASRRGVSHLASPRTNPLRTAAAQRSAGHRASLAVQAVAAPPAPAANASRPKALAEQDKSLQKPTVVITGERHRLEGCRPDALILQPPAAKSTHTSRSAVLTHVVRPPFPITACRRLLRPGPERCQLPGAER